MFCVGNRVLGLACGTRVRRGAAAMLCGLKHSRSPDVVCVRCLQCPQKRDKIVLVLLREVEIKARVIEIDSVKKKEK